MLFLELPSAAAGEQGSKTTHLGQIGLLLRPRAKTGERPVWKDTTRNEGFVISGIGTLRLNPQVYNHSTACHRALTTHDTIPSLLKSNDASSEPPLAPIQSTQ
jgi:hypothetical protein